MQNNVIMSIVCAAFLVSCAPAGERAVAQLGDNPTVSGGKYTTGGGLTVAADLRESSGRTLVCGVWAQSRQQSILTKGKANRVVSKGSIFLGRERVVQNFLFMKEVDPSPSYGGQDAGCLLLERPWTATDAQRNVLIRIPRQVVSNEIDEQGGGFLVYFIDTGRPEAGPN